MIITKGVSALIFFLGITGTIHLVGTFTPTAVIKGKLSLASYDTMDFLEQQHMLKS